MDIKEYVENDLGVILSQTDIDAYIPQAQTRLDRAKVDDSLRPAYLAMLVSELIRADLLSAFCAGYGRTIRKNREERDRYKTKSRPHRPSLL